VKKATDHKNQREKRLRLSDDLIWGIHPIYEALENESDRILEIFALKERKGGKWEEIIASARKQKVKISFVDSLKITGENSSQVRHQGLVARMSQVAVVPFEEMVQSFKEQIREGNKPRLIICDSLQDPHNLGAVIRSALASGASGVVITSEKSAPLGGIAAKSSAGAISHIPISRVINLSNALLKLKEAGGWVFGAVKEADATSLYDADLSVPSCFVVGSEGKGIRPLVKKHCDVLLSIPMVGNLDSLNSSVAAAVILFEALRQNQ